MLDCLLSPTSNLREFSQFLISCLQSHGLIEGGTWLAGQQEATRLSHGRGSMHVGRVHRCDQLPVRHVAPCRSCGGEALV